MINEKKIKSIQDKIKLAISEIEKEENVKIEFSSIKFNIAHYVTQMTVKTLDRTDKVDSIYKSMCSRLGFTQNIIGMKFDGMNGIYEIIDIQTRNRKYPVIAKSSDGKKYKYSVDHIKKLIGGDKIINRNANLDKLIK